MKLEIKKVSKRYTKNKFGIKDFSLILEPGILGLLGPNGAGKSTLMRMIATIDKPTQGMILLNDIDIRKNPNYIRKQLGYLPQDFGVYDNLNAFEFLEYMAALKGLGGSSLKERILGLLEGLNLSQAAHDKLLGYSGGMKQRVGIAQALLNDPKIIIFDEPTVGLDPEERVRFRNLVADLATDRIIILSSHIVSDIETIADAVAIIKEGSLLVQNTQEKIIETVKGKVFETSIEPDDLRDFKNTHLVVGNTRKAGKSLVRFIADLPIANALPKPATLEDAYLYFTR